MFIILINIYFLIFRILTPIILLNYPLNLKLYKILFWQIKINLYKLNIINMFSLNNIQIILIFIFLIYLKYFRK